MAINTLPNVPFNIQWCDFLRNTCCYKNSLFDNNPLLHVPNKEIDGLDLHH